MTEDKSQGKILTLYPELTHPLLVKILMMALADNLLGKIDNNKLKDKLLLGSKILLQGKALLDSKVLLQGKPHHGRISLHLSRTSSSSKMGKTQMIFSQIQRM